MHFFEQKYKLLTETKRNRKWKISHSFRERPLVSQPIEESQIKKKSCDELQFPKEKKDIFLQFISSEDSFFKICVLSQCIVY